MAQETMMLKVGMNDAEMEGYMDAEHVATYVWTSCILSSSLVWHIDFLGYITHYHVS